MRCKVGRLLLRLVKSDRFILEPAGSVFILRDVRYDILDQRRKT